MRAEPNTLPVDAFVHVKPGAYAKVVRATRLKGQWVVPNGNVTYIKIENGGRGPKSSQRNYINITEKIKAESEVVQRQAWQAVQHELKAPVPTKTPRKRATGSWFGTHSMKGYLHWYSVLDGVSRPCVNGFRMMAYLDPRVALAMLHNACKLAREYTRHFAPFKRANPDELVLTVAFRFLSGPYGEETGNDDRSLWGVMTDRPQKDCDDLTMAACAVFYAVTGVKDIDIGQYDPAVRYLQSRFARAFFVQGEATPNVAQCESGGHVFMILTRAEADAPGAPLTARSFRNGLLVECTTPMMPPNAVRSQPDSDDSGPFVCALKNYELDKYTSIVALYTPYDTYFAQTENGLGVPANILLGDADTGVYIHTNTQFKISSELIASGQSNFLYEYYDPVFVRQLKDLMGLGTRPASEGASFRCASWGCAPNTAAQCTAFEVGGGSWCIFRPPDHTQAIRLYDPEL